jgi:hypothetical protein
MRQWAADRVIGCGEVLRSGTLFPARRIFVYMRSLSSVVVAGILFGSMAGCHHSGTGSSSGNNPNNSGGQTPSHSGKQSNSGNGGTDGEQHGGKQGSADAGNRNQTHTEPVSSEPVTSVSGQPSAESDRGSPSAVAHHSVAQPGAPQGTAPQPSQKRAPKSPPAPSASPQR